MRRRDGWLHAGDVGRIDEDGNVFVVDRLKELIKVSGYKVAPAGLGPCSPEHPAVADVAVVSRPDERRGEVPVAFVVGDVGEAELLAWAAERVAASARARCASPT